MKAPTCSTRLQCQEAQNQNLSCLHYRLLTKIVPSRPFADIVLFQTSVRMSGCGGSPEHVLDGEETAAAIHGGGQQESGPGISLSPFLLFLLSFSTFLIIRPFSILHLYFPLQEEAGVGAGSLGKEEPPVVRQAALRKFTSRNGVRKKWFVFLDINIPHY